MLRLLPLMTALVLLVLGSTAVYAAPPAAPPETLAEALRLVQQARSETGETQERTVAAVREVLQRDRELVSSLPWLTDALQAGRYDLQRSEAQLTAALAAVGQSDRNLADPRRAEATLRGLLSAPPFVTTTWVDALPDWLRPYGELAMAIILIALDGVQSLLMQAVRLFYEFSQTPFALGAGLVVVVALLLLYRFALRSAIVREVGAADALDVAGMTHEAALARAQELFETGHYRDASHYLLASVFLWCDARGLLRFAPTKTNREHLTQLRARPQLSAGLTPLVNRFDRLWYGQDTVSDSDYLDLAAMAAAVKQVAA